MSDPVVIPPVAVATSEPKLPILVGCLIVVLSFALIAAILFFPAPESTNDAEKQQVLTIVAGLVMAFTGWLFGSSQSSAKKDATIATLAPPKGP